MKSLKWLAAGVVVVAIAVGAVFAAARSDPAQAQTAPSGQAEALISQRSGLSLDTIHKLETAYLAVAADKGSAGGMLTPDQANKFRSLTAGPILDRLLSAITTATGTQANDIITGLQQGQSLSQIAAAHGVQRADLRTRLLASIQTEVATDQSAGLLQPAQASMINVALNANIDKLIDATHQPHVRQPTVAHP